VQLIRPDGEEILEIFDMWTTLMEIRERKHNQLKENILFTEKENLNGKKSMQGLYICKKLNKEWVLNQSDYYAMIETGQKNKSGIKSYLFSVTSMELSKYLSLPSSKPTST
jgi:hypothetical protein